jgi:hypothetical protein
MNVTKAKQLEEVREISAITYGFLASKPCLNRLRSSSTLPFLNPAISEMQETSHWPTHRWNVMSEQRKSDWQHPNSYYRKREETEHAAADESDTSRHPQPFRTIPTKAVQVMADPGRDVILEALHFLVEIGNPHHRFIPMVARRSTTAWEILWSRPTEVLDGHCVPFARPKYRRQPLGPPNGRFWPFSTFA